MTVPFTHLDRVYIGGEWVSPGNGSEPVINPATEEPFAHAPVASVGQINDAIGAARIAFDDGPWPRMSMNERADVMARMASALRTRQS